MDEPAPRREMLSVNQVTLLVRDSMSGGPPVLCLHGRWGCGETWNDLVARYRDGFRLIVPDQRGHGQSDKPATGYANRDLAEDARQLLRELRATPAIVIGHSMGGRVAAFLAASHPKDVRAVAILDCGAEGSEPIREVPPEQITGVDPLTADWPTPYPSREAAERDLKARFPRATNVRYFLDSLVETADGFDFLFSRSAMAALEAYSKQDWTDLLPRLRCPVLLVRAAESWELSAEHAQRMRSRIPDCTYVEISDSDHMVYADNPGEFYPALDAWLSRV